MNGGAPVDEGESATASKHHWSRCAALGALCALVIGIYAWSAQSGFIELLGTNAEGTYYNLLVQGFRAGQLNLKAEVAPGLAQLSDPYDAAASLPYRWLPGRPVHDLSYYRGKLYLYFGVTPAVLLFWPFVALTGHYLLPKAAVVVLFSTGFLAGAGLLWALWRRYFPEVRFAVLLAGILAFGLASFIPPILSRCDVYEVAISGGYAFVMLALVGIWGALHQPRRRGWWLAGASLAYGLALGARPSLLFGAVILLVPLIVAWRRQSRPTDGSNAESSNCPLTPSLSPSEGERVPKAGEGAIVKNPGTRTANSQRVWPLWVAAFGPITIIGLGLMLYNALRFGNPLEFGQRYQLPRPDVAHQFSLDYLWFNFRVAFLEPARWSARFPFVHDIALPPLPTGADVEHPFGVLTNIPLIWLALAAPLAWRGRPAAARSALGWFLAAVAALFGIGALTLGLHNSMCLRYEVEFAAPLVWLAIAGIFGLERALAGQPSWRRAARAGWGLLLAASVLFNLFARFELYADTDNVLGNLLLRNGQVDEAIARLEKALGSQPDQAEIQSNLGLALLEKGRIDDAILRFHRALALDPRSAPAHLNLGLARFQQGNVTDAVLEFETAVQLRPNLVDARNNLGTALLQQGRTDEALVQFRKAVALQPGSAQALNNLGLALTQKGQLDEALASFQKSVALRPNDALARDNLGNLLLRRNRVDEALAHLEKAVALQPELADAHNHLANALVRKHRVKEAMAHWQRAVELRPDPVAALSNLAWALATCPDAPLRDGNRAIELAQRASQLAGGGNPVMLRTLAAAYAEAGRFAEAVATAQQALQLAQARTNTALGNGLQRQIELYQAGSPFRDPALTNAP